MDINWNSIYILESTQGDTQTIIESIYYDIKRSLPLAYSWNASIGTGPLLLSAFGELSTSASKKTEQLDDDKLRMQRTKKQQENARTHLMDDKIAPRPL